MYDNNKTNIWDAVTSIAIVVMICFIISQFVSCSIEVNKQSYQYLYEKAKIKEKN